MTSFTCIAQVITHTGAWSSSYGLPMFDFLARDHDSAREAASLILAAMPIKGDGFYFSFDVVRTADMIPSPL